MNRRELLLGVGHVQYEWTQMGGCAARLGLVDRIRTPEDNATLEEALGVKVDVGTPASLRERLRDEVLAEAVTL